MNSGGKPNLVADDLDSDGKDFQEGDTPEKPGQYQSNVMHIRFNLGTTGRSVVQEASNRKRATFQERNRTRVSCAECGGIMTASSLCHHMEMSHGIFLPHTRGVDFWGGDSETYVVSFLCILKSVECTVEGCP